MLKWCMKTVCAVPLMHVCVCGGGDVVGEAASCRHVALSTTTCHVIDVVMSKLGHPEHPWVAI